jgi:hypothetical protein
LVKLNRFLVPIEDIEHYAEAINFLSNASNLLARLANALTICARDTYEVGSEVVLQPGVLRAYNELLHRVTGAVRDHLLGSEAYSLEDILEMMRVFGEKNQRTTEIKWALEQATKNPLSGN